jgi:hypothetical protein
MKSLRVVVATLAAAVAGASCAWPTSRAEPPLRAAAPRHAATQPAPAALEPETRYYVDETGAVWNDRGIKQHAKP